MTGPEAVAVAMLAGVAVSGLAAGIELARGLLAPGGAAVCLVEMWAIAGAGSSRVLG